MEPEREKPELQPKPAGPSGSIPMPGPGERVPMPAGPGSARRRAGEKSAGRFGLVAAAILTAGLAAAMVFRGEFRQAQQTAPPAPTAAEVVVAAPLSTPPPLPPLSAEPPSEPPSTPLWGGPKEETVKPAPGSFSSPPPFFSSDEDQAVPKVSALQPYNTAPEASRQTSSARTVLPAANQLIPRLQPNRTNAISRAGSGPAATAPCTTNCKGAVLGTKTNTALQGGTSYVQNEVTTSYAGVCDGKYVYDYTNITTNKTIGMEVRTSGGESWTFTLKPGQKTSIKSSTEFTSGTYENLRASEVMN